MAFHDLLKMIGRATWYPSASFENTKQPEANYIVQLSVPFPIDWAFLQKSAGIIDEGVQKLFAVEQRLALCCQQWKQKPWMKEDRGMTILISRSRSFYNTISTSYHSSRAKTGFDGNKQGIQWRHQIPGNVQVDGKHVESSWRSAVPGNFEARILPRTRNCKIQQY